MLCFCLLSVTACSGGAGSASAPQAEGGNESEASAGFVSPPVYYDQTTVLTGEDGEPVLERSYKKLLADCQQGGAPTHALTPEEQVKVGRTHMEVWIGNGRFAKHQEDWGIADEPPCQFSLKHETDQTEIYDANGRATTVDHLSHKVDVQETGKPAPVTPMPPEDGEVTEGERATGWSKKGAASANGAQCEIWEDRSGYQLCVWTGGRKWGYPTDGPIALKDGLSNGGSIVLWAHGGKDPNWRLETREFTVGTPIDERAFVPPVQ